MNQSIGLVILQIIGIFFGFFSVFWIAGSLPAKEFAIVGIYNIISTLILVFSNTGIETKAIRIVLEWKEEGRIDNIKLLITQALVYRTLFATVLFVPVIGYAVYISLNKFDGHYLDLFILMGFLSIANALNDSAVLLLRAFNEYFSAALVTYSVNVFGKIFALFLFINYGFNTYIHAIMLIPLVITLPVLYKLKSYLSFNGVLKKNNIHDVLRESKFFAITSYISFIFNYLDQLIVSVFLSTEALGTFTIAKNIFAISKTFIENIFDPMLQNLVSFKRDLFQFKTKLEKIFRIKNYLLIISAVFFPLVLIFSTNILELLNLNQYLYLKYFIVLIYLSQIVLIATKIKYNYICLFYPQLSYIKITSINALLSVFFLVVIVLVNPKYLFLNVLLTNLLMFVYSEKYFNKPNNPFYNEICT
jgi:O-antigen/teichoic acid export membrane protein